MTTGDVTITRGVGTRDDFLTATMTWSGSTNVSGTFTSDGDQGMLSDTFTSAVNGNFGGANENLPALSTNTYPKVMIRHFDNGLGGNPSPALQVFYTSGSDTFNLTISSTYINETFALTAGKTLSNMSVILTANASLTGTFSLTTDFIMFFKETLTLPAASQPLSFPLSRRIGALQVPNREGDILQDLGSGSPTVQIDGRLITTTGPNNYTGDQWWDVLVGTWLEHNWQWFTSDRVAYKYHITDLAPTQNPGQVGYYGFTMKLRKVDILSATAQTFSSNNNPSGAIQ